MTPKFRAYDGGSLNRMYQPDEVMVGNGDIWIVDEDSVAGEWIVNNDLHLMQSTGLRDKKGKGIFEGDIVQFEDCSEMSDSLYINTGIIEWCQGGFHVTNRDSVSMGDLLDGDVLDVKIIGNIYENKDILEDKE